MTNGDMNIIVMTGKPLSIVTMIWIASAVLIPVSCVAIFVLTWIRHRQGGEILWQPRTIFLGALGLGTLTLIQISCKLNEAFYFAATNIWGEGQQAAVHLAFAKSCTIFTVGTLATSFVVALGLLLPSENKKHDQIGAKQGPVP